MDHTCHLQDQPAPHHLMSLDFQFHGVTKAQKTYRLQPARRIRRQRQLSKLNAVPAKKLSSVLNADFSAKAGSDS